MKMAPLKYWVLFGTFVIGATVIFAAIKSTDCDRYDLNCDGQVNVLDVQLVVNEYLTRP